MIPKDPVYLLTAALERVKDTIPDQDAEGWLSDAFAADRIEWAYLWIEGQNRIYPSLIKIPPMAANIEIPGLKIDRLKGTVEVRRRYKGVVECPVVVSRRDLDRELDKITASPEATDRQPDGDQISYAGRPSKIKAILQEMRRRAEKKVLCPTLAAEARALCQWGNAKFPDDQIPKELSMQNAIRSEYTKIRPTPI